MEGRKEGRKEGVKVSESLEDRQQEDSSGHGERETVDERGRGCMAASWSVSGYMSVICVCFAFQRTRWSSNTTHPVWAGSIYSSVRHRRVFRCFRPNVLLVKSFCALCSFNEQRKIFNKQTAHFILFYCVYMWRTLPPFQLHTVFWMLFSSENSLFI